MQTIVIIPAEYKTTLNRIIEQEFFSPYVRDLDIFQAKLYDEEDQIQDSPSHYWTTQSLSEKAFIKCVELKRLFPGSIVEVYDDDISHEYPEILIKNLGLVRKTPIMPP